MTERTSTTKRALVVIDVQNEYEVGALPIEFPPLESSLAAIGRALEAAKAEDIPIVLVQQDMPVGAPAFVVGTETWELHRTVASQPAALRIHKDLPGAFTGTELEEWLRAHAITTVTLVGYMTQHCVDSTARQARHRGFDVEVLSDATGSVSYRNAAGFVDAETMHLVQLVALQAGFAAVATTADWIAAVAAGEELPLDNPVTSVATAFAGMR